MILWKIGAGILSLIAGGLILIKSGNSLEILFSLFFFALGLGGIFWGITGE